MATLNIKILNPIIDLISEETYTTTSCEVISVFTIKSVGGNSITLDIVPYNADPKNYNKVEVYNGSSWVEVTGTTYNFVLNKTGQAKVKIRVGNFDFGTFALGSSASQCFGVYIDITDTTLDKKERGSFRNCNQAERCDTVVVTPDEPTIDEHTNIFIYFDASGSMNETLPPLRDMRDNASLLKAKLLPYYNNNETTYNSKVKIIEVDINNPAYEDPFEMLNYEGKNVSGKVISLAFINEADIHAIPPFDYNEPSNINHNNSIGRFRTRLNSFPTNYYKGVWFQVATTSTHQGEQEEYDAFAAYSEANKLGLGVYAGTNGLSERTETTIKLDVAPEATGQYYTDLVIDSLNELGFNL